MAQQTINVGTAPNDGTGTPLRTAFQYTNSNFSELYTALGGGSGLPGSSSQVIFNDGGTNLAGDSGLVFNKTTDTLGTGRLTTSGDAIVCSSTGDFYVGTTLSPQFKVERATGAATITGDLTVATDRLKVVTGSTAIQTGATTQLQVGTTSWPSGVIGKSGSRSLFGNTGEVVIWNEAAAAIGNYSTLFVSAKTGAGATTMGGLQIRAGIENASNSDGFVSLWTSNSAAGGFVERYKIDSTGVATWSNVGGVAGTAMTLNSTGLGVGGSPSSRLDVANSGTPVVFSMTLTGAQRWQQIIDTSVGNWTLRDQTGSKDVLIATAGSGNVGIGVTPSAWATSTTVWRALDLQYSCGLASSGAGSGEIDLLWNAYYDQTDQRWEFKYTGDRASRYSIGGSGVHAWYNTASTGTANGAITWTQAMTLDASGRLLVGSTSNPAYDGFRGFFYNNGNNTLISQCDSANYCLLLYTGNGTNVGSAAAFKYGATTVGSIQTTASSTAYNTSSDYRLKESVQPMTGALNRVAALKPSTYKWKVDGSAGEGFIAHELADVVPLAVTGEKDAVNEDGSIKPQGVDLSKVVPILVAAIQELTAEVNALKNA